MKCCQTESATREKSLLREVEDRRKPRTFTMAEVCYGPPLVVHLKKQGGNII